MALFDLLGRSWAMGIVWNLSDGPLNFRELQARCESVSPTTLNRRLRELRDSQIVQTTKGGYALTRMGRQLVKRLLPLSSFAKTWARKLTAAKSS